MDDYDKGTKTGMGLVLGIGIAIIVISKLISWATYENAEERTLKAGGAEPVSCISHVKSGMSNILSTCRDASMTVWVCDDTRSCVKVDDVNSMWLAPKVEKP